MIYFLTNQKELNLKNNDEIKILPLNYKVVYDYFKGVDHIGVDLETTGLSPFTKKIKTIQLGDEINQFVIAVEDITPLKELLESKLLILQNAKFDLQFFYLQNIFPKRVWDTYLAERNVYNGVYKPKGFYKLDAIILRHLEEIIDKSLQGKIGRAKINLKFIEYAAGDVRFLYKVMLSQKELLQKYNLLAEAELNNEFVRVIVYIILSGIKLYKKAWQKKVDRYRKLRADAMEELDKLANEFLHYEGAQISLFGGLTGINWNSPKQVIPLFKSLDCGLKLLIPDDKTGKMKYSLDKKLLQPQKDKHPIIPLYIKYSEYNKEVTTYGENFYNSIQPSTGRIHTDFTQTKNTGRMSSGGKNEYGVNLVNLQNIPASKETRSCFVPESGNSFIGSDYDGQETCILAEYADDNEYTDYIRNPEKDLHCLVASLAYLELADVSHLDIKENHSDKRGYVKPGTFCIPYGGNEYTIASNLDFPIDVGKRIYDGVMNAFPGLNVYFDKAKQFGKDNGYVLLNPITKGRCWVNDYPEYLELSKTIDWGVYWQYRNANMKMPEELYKQVNRFRKISGTIERASLNYPIQGMGAAMTKQACIYFFDYILENNLQWIVRIPNVIHDEILAECPTEMAEDIAKVVKISMERAGSDYCKKVPITAKPKISTCWQK